MKKPILYTGFTLVSEEADGHQRVSFFDGFFYAGLDELQVVGVQDVLNSEFGERWDALKREMEARLIEMGYGNAIANGSDPADADKMRGLVSGVKGNKVKSDR
jgi:hypothetical protein